MDSETTEPGTWSGLALVVLTLIWLIGTPYLFMVAFGEGLRGSLGGPSDGDRATRFLIASAVVGVAAPALAAIVAGMTRRKSATWVFGVSTALCLLLVTAINGIGQREADSTPTREPLPPGYCVEHSGGGNDCPGG
ncbi:hypothetical protein Psi02_72670 [Planotetraspora silvatica]|uniref:Uncharacterized protein n=1 Tax=Planotetraspora silvatica TaxID=234614 RepID=A0A8J3UT61_9ACTN|nr:hypothetical protein Psi02_72670 [Planotetraspora silvatica]